MARAAQQKVYADFRQGFVTVANPLAYPEGAVKDIVNFDIQDNGTLRVRPGLRQDTATTVDTGFSVGTLNNLALSVHVWDNVANQGSFKIAVVQVGTNLHFYEMTDDGIDMQTPVDSSFNMGIPSAGQDTTISTASGSGWLFVAHPSITPFVLKYEDDNILSEDIDIKIRDLSIWDGGTDERTGYERSGSLYPFHEYNLRNGGWPQSADTSTDNRIDSPIASRDPVDWTNSKIGYYPPISVPFYASRQGGGGTVPQQSAYSPWGIRNDYWGDSPIPRGKFIKSAASWSRAGVGVTPVNSDPSSTSLTKTYEWTQYPTSIEFYSGRVWYTGAKGYKETSSIPSYTTKDDIDVTNTLYFSQQIEGDLDKVGKCYQENDPTAEDINQLLATDGGTLSIRGAGEILDIKTFGTSLIVFSEEGIWAVSGVDTNSFKADSYSVNKISNIGPSSKNTISATGNTIYYIANDAIYILTTDDVTGLPIPQDISSAKIKDFYNSIPYAQKEKAKAFFDTANRNLYIFYSAVDSPVTETSNIYYNKCLIFNQDLGCFYKYDVTINSHYIVDGLFYNKDQVVTLSEPITLDGVAVTLDSEPVTLEDSYSTASLNNVQLLTVYDNGTTGELMFSSFTDTTDRQDWGQDYTGYVEFGFDVAGDIMRDSLKTPVIISHMERTEDGFEINPDDPDNQELIFTNSSGCLLSYGWDWATNYKNPIQIYRFNRNYVPSGTSDPFNYGVDVITTRNRIRGKGHSLGVRLDSEAGKDCRILGLGILYTQAQRI